MRHLHFVQSLEPLQGAGLGLSALQLHLALRKRGASQLLTTRAATFEPVWPDVFQGVRSGPAKAYYSPEVHARAREAVAASDWVHGHGFYVYPNWRLGAEARRQKRPLVYHVQGFFDPWILRRSRWKKQLAEWLFEDRNFQAVRFWRAVSAKEAGQIRACGFTQPVEVIPNGIDLAEIDGALPSPRAVPVKKRPKRLLFLSRLHPKKGLDMLIPAWGRLALRFPDWELCIVGPNEGGYQTRLEELIAEHGVGETCCILPSVFGAEKQAVLRSADAFVLPSYSEGFPMAVLEAAAHRLPIVLTSECNFPALAAAGGAWECLPRLNDLHDALGAMLSASDAERTERGEVARGLVERDYVWDRIAFQLEEACRRHGRA